MTKSFTPAQISEIIEMALSDHIRFNQISAQHGVTPDEIKTIMRTQLKPGSYRTWRKRVDRLKALSDLLACLPSRFSAFQCNNRDGGKNGDSVSDCQSHIFVRYGVVHELIVANAGT